MTELYLLCSRVRQENLQLCNAWNYHSKTPGAWGKPTPQTPLCPSLLYWEQPWKSFSLRPNLYTCGCQPSLVLDLTLEGELRARFGSGAVMCFFCCALKYIFSFLPRAPGLSGSMNSLTYFLGHENIWVFIFLVLHCFAEPLQGPPWRGSHW